MKGLTKNDLLDCVKGYAAGMSSLTRYAQKGLILTPYRTEKYLSDGSRVLYHPITPIEFISAARLRQQYGIEAKHIFIGRIEALNEALSAFEGDETFCDTINHIGKSYSFDDYHIRYKDKDGESNIPMTSHDIEYYRIVCRAHIRSNYYDQNTRVTDAYLKYLSEIYKHIFMNTYKWSWTWVYDRIKEQE